jgi:DNA-directed RNA polymerase specialized sigma subunit
MDKKTRDDLIIKYAPLVKTIVLRMAAKMPIDAAWKNTMSRGMSNLRPTPTSGSGAPYWMN